MVTGIIGLIRFGHVGDTLLFDQIVKACQQIHGSLWYLLEKGVQLFGGRCTYGLEDRSLIGKLVVV